MVIEKMHRIFVSMVTDKLPWQTKKGFFCLGEVLVAPREGQLPIYFIWMIMHLLRCTISHVII